MGKQQKPKPVSQSGKRRIHNKATKGNNTRKRGATWERLFVIKTDKKTGEETEVSFETRVPYGTLYDPSLDSAKYLNSPFDAIQLDWVDELAHYAARINGKIIRDVVPNGMFEYKLISPNGDVACSIMSWRNAFFNSPKGARRKRARKN